MQEVWVFRPSRALHEQHKVSKGIIQKQRELSNGNGTLNLANEPFALIACNRSETHLLSYKFLG